MNEFRSFVDNSKITIGGELASEGKLRGRDKFYYLEQLEFAAENLNPVVGIKNHDVAKGLRTNNLFKRCRASFKCSQSQHFHRVLFFGCADNPGMINIHIGIPFASGIAKNADETLFHPSSHQAFFLSKSLKRIESWHVSTGTLRGVLLFEFDPPPAPSERYLVKLSPSATYATFISPQDKIFFLDDLDTLLSNGETLRVILSHNPVSPSTIPNVILLSPFEPREPEYAWFRIPEKVQGPIIDLFLSLEKNLLIVSKPAQENRKDPHFTTTSLVTGERIMNLCPSVFSNPKCFCVSIHLSTIWTFEDDNTSCRIFAYLDRRDREGSGCVHIASRWPPSSRRLEKFKFSERRQEHAAWIDNEKIIVLVMAWNRFFCLGDSLTTVFVTQNDNDKILDYSLHRKGLIVLLNENRLVFVDYYPRTSKDGVIGYDHGWFFHPYKTGPAEYDDQDLEVEYMSEADRIPLQVPPLIHTWKFEGRIEFLQGDLLGEPTDLFLWFKDDRIFCAKFLNDDLLRVKTLCFQKQTRLLPEIHKLVYEYLR